MDPKEKQISLSEQLSLKAGVVRSDQIKLPTFRWHGILRDKKGEIIDEQFGWNQVQTAYKTHVADQLSDQGDSAISHMAIGTGTGQGVGDNTLATELDRQALDNATPSHAGAVVTYHRTFAAGEGTGTVTEAGVFNDPSAGTMGLYDDTLNFTKGASSSLELTWTMTVN